MINNIDIKKTIRKILIDKDMSQNELAEKMGMLKQNFSRIINKDISQWKVEDIEKVFNALEYDLKIEFVERKK